MASPAEIGNTMTEVSRQLYEDTSLQTLTREPVGRPQLERPAIPVEPVDSVGSSGSNLLLQTPTRTGSEEQGPWTRKNVLTLGKLLLSLVKQARH